MVIIVYYFLLGVGLTLLLQDVLLVSATGEGNTTYSLLNTTDINMTSDEMIGEGKTLKTFPNTLKIMFAFSTPKIAGLPSTLVAFISFINWFLLIIFGISVYRIINPLS